MDAEKNRGGVLRTCSVTWCTSMATDGADLCAIHRAKPVMRSEDRETWEKRLRSEERRRKNAAAKAASEAKAAEQRRAAGKR